MYWIRIKGAKKLKKISVQGLFLAQIRLGDRVRY